MRIVLLLALAAFLPLIANVDVLLAANGQNREIQYAAPAPASPHGGMIDATDEAPQGMAGVIQDATLSGYKSMKIGEAFNRYRYFKKKAWSETRGAPGTFYVDFVGLSPSGWFDFDAKKKGVTSRGIEIKFVVHRNGSYEVGMVSKVEVKTDGKTYRYPLADFSGILDAIYANAKIKL